MSKDNLLVNFRKLIKFGESKLLKVRLDIAKDDFRLLTIFTLIGAIHYYAESIMILAKHKKLFTGETLLRSLFEGFLNLKYILLEENEKNAIKYAIKDFTNRKEFTEKWKSFIEANPKYSDYINELSTIEKCDEFINEIEKNIENIEKKFEVSNKLPDLRSMAKVIDTKIKDHHFEFAYLTFYDYLCDISHVSSKGLKNFFISYGNGYIFCIGKNDSEEIYKLLIAAYEFYLNTLVIFSDNFKKLSKEELKPYLEFFNKIGETVK
ncbi:MAG: DUF5677 domain-containing protein [Actinobacteria bacterium]|nr:DUF5677 domain-containing protein [Actinomycetota bacterium]